MEALNTCLWFEGNAVEAAKFYVSVFKKNSKILAITRYGETSAKSSGQPKGSVMTVSFKLRGREFMALNGGPVFKHSPAVSFMVLCKTQKEVDYFWKKLSAGGEEVECGWLKDKYGISWQIVPEVVDRVMKSKDPKKMENMMKGVVTMKKLDAAALQRAANGKS